MRYAYATTAALLLGGTAITLTTGPVGAQVAQNEEGRVARAMPPGGAPQSFADLVEQLQPAVVNISTEQTVTVASNPMMDFLQGRRPGPSRPQTQQGESLGSGFIISADGYVVTNNHVVAPGAQGAVVNSITVTLPDRTEYTAKLVGRDPTSDLAVLKIDAPNALPFVKLGDSERLRVGDWVVAIGNPLGQSGTVTAGIVSAVHRVTGQGSNDRFIQTDAAINQGNSGGPLFDMSGNVVGINSQILSRTGGNIGIGLAIPAFEARPVIDQLIRGQSVERGYLGVGIQEIDDRLADSLGLDKNRGELITSVQPGGAAERAGLRTNDVVMTVNGREVTPDTTLSYLVANLKPGTRVPIEVLRDGRRQTVTAELQQRPSEDELAQSLELEDGMAPENSTPQQGQAGASLGLVLQPLTSQIAGQLGVPATTRGVVIAAVDGSSRAGQIGFQRGDVILSANRRSVTTPEEVQAIVNEAATAGRSSVALLIQRGRGPARYVSVPFSDLNR